jgi:hypothetical protein
MAEMSPLRRRMIEETSRVLYLEKLRNAPADRHQSSANVHLD